MDFSLMLMLIEVIVTWVQMCKLIMIHCIQVISVQFTVQEEAVTVATWRRADRVDMITYHCEVTVFG